MMGGNRNSVASMGYQSRGQVPIPIEYANFLELSEFADAVIVVRAHRLERIRRQGQQHGLRFNEDNNEQQQEEEAKTIERNNIDENADRNNRENVDQRVEESNALILSAAVNSLANF